MRLIYKKEAAASWAKRIAAHSQECHAIIRACDIQNTAEGAQGCKIKLHTLHSEDDLPDNWQTQPNCTLHLAPLAERPEYGAEWY